MNFSAYPCISCFVDQTKWTNVVPQCFTFSMLTSSWLRRIIVNFALTFLKWQLGSSWKLLDLHSTQQSWMKQAHTLSFPKILCINDLLILTFGEILLARLAYCWSLQYWGNYRSMQVANGSLLCAVIVAELINSVKSFFCSIVVQYHIRQTSTWSILLHSAQLKGKPQFCFSLVHMILRFTCHWNQNSWNQYSSFSSDKINQKFLPVFSYPS